MSRTSKQNELYNKFVNDVKRDPSLLNKTGSELAEIYGGHYTTYNNWKKKFESEKKDIPVTPSAEFSHTDSDACAKSISPDIRTPEQLVAHLKIDLTKYRIESWKSNQWQGFAVIKEQIVKTTLYQLDVRFKSDPVASKVKANFLADINNHKFRYKEIKFKKQKDKVYALEISPFDIHSGKVTLEKDDIETVVVEAVQEIISLAPIEQIEEIVIVLGQDMCNVDNFFMTTTKGTPQDNITSIPEMIRKARRICVSLIDMARQIAKVKVIFVEGNHDRMLTYAIGDMIAAWYRNDPNVTVDNEESPRKYYRYYDNLIAFTHGDEENHRDLGAIVATESPLLWGATKFREIHLGHFHKSKKTTQVDVDSFAGYKIRVLPSLSGTDRWHKRKGYLSHREMEAYLYHKHKGLKAILPYRYIPTEPFKPQRP